MPISDPCTAVWLFLEIKQSCFIFTLQEMDSEFRGRDNRETCALTFSASCHHQEKRNARPKCQGQRVCRAGKGAGRTPAVQHRLQEQAGHPDTLTLLDAPNLPEPAPESCPHLQCSAVAENLSLLSGKGWSNRETRLRSSKALALLSAPVQVQGDTRKGPHVSE